MSRNKGYLIENLHEINEDFIETMQVYGKRRKPINHEYLLKQKRIEDYMYNGGYTVKDVYKQIENKTCKLSAVLRRFFLVNYNVGGNR